MSSDRNPIFGGGLRASDDVALEESGLLGPHRRWTNINRYEVIFLISALLAAMVTDGLTIYRLSQLHDDISDPDFAYGIIILVTSVFLLIFLATGIFQQRITDIVVFFVCALMMTIYVIAQFVYREFNPPSKDTPTDKKLRLVRLIFTCVFNIIFVPLSIFVIRDYERDEFAKRLFGAFPAQRWPLRIYNILDCLARINTMLSISVYVLSLYNFNDFQYVDDILLSIGIPLCFLWLGVTIGMIRMESYLLVVFFAMISLFQPGFLIYSAYSNIEDPTTSSPILPTTTAIVFNTTISPNETALIQSDFFVDNNSTMSSSTKPPVNHVPVPVALFVCMALNICSHIASCVCAGLCVKNFGKGLKEKVFNNRADKLFRKCFSRS